MSEYTVIPQIVVNSTNEPITLVDVASWDGTPITLLPNVSVDLSTLALDVDLAKSFHLENLTRTMKVRVISTFMVSQLQAGTQQSMPGILQFYSFNFSYVDVITAAGGTIATIDSLLSLASGNAIMFVAIQVTTPFLGGNINNTNDQLGASSFNLLPSGNTLGISWNLSAPGSASGVGAPSFSFVDYTQAWEIGFTVNSSSTPLSELTQGQARFVVGYYTGY